MQYEMLQAALVSDSCLQEHYLLERIDVAQNQGVSTSVRLVHPLLCLL